MRIAFISQYFFPESFSNNEITKDLVKRSHDVDVITCVPNYPEGVFFPGYSNSSRRSEEWHGVMVHRARTVARGKSSISLLTNYIVFVIFGTWQARKLARSQCPDVSFVSMPSPLTQALVGVYLKKFHAVPLVYWVQDIWPESATHTLGLKHPFIVRPLTALCGWLYRQADLIMTQSAAFQPMIARFGAPDEKIEIFPNTAPDTFARIPQDDIEDAARLDIPDGLRVMFAGNIGESQDFDTLIDTATLLKKSGQVVQWIIVGSGRDMARVQQRIQDEELTESFHFLGRFPEAKMPELFAQADALLVSLRRSDIFALTVPYKIQSYMACGKPILASLDGEGARIVTQANAGLAVPAQSPALFYDAICAFFALSDEERHAFGDNGLAYFQKHYSAKVLYDRLEKALTRVSKR